jgi:hypothetical protein
MMRFVTTVLVCVAAAALALEAAAGDKETIKALKDQVHKLRQQETATLRAIDARFNPILRGIDKPEDHLERVRAHLRREEAAALRRIDARYNPVLRRIDKPEDHLERIRAHLRHMRNEALEG